MVDVLGHVAGALLVTLPVWLVWGPRRSVAFVALALLTAMLPDVDLYVPGLRHHGPTHTLTFVAAAALVGAALVTLLASPFVDRWFRDRRRPVSTRTAYAFAASALFVGGASHVLMDLLASSAPGLPINPFWPVFRKPFSVYVIEEFSSPLYNGVLLALAIVGHLLLYALTVVPASDDGPV